MADVPLAVTIAIGSVPIAGAGIAGFVALANTTGRRIERLKNLVEVHAKLPKFEQTTKRMIVRELQGIEFATDPRCRRLRRAAVGSFVVYLVLFSATFLPVLYSSSFSRWSTSIANIVFILASYIISVKLDRRKLQLIVAENQG